MGTSMRWWKPGWNRPRGCNLCTVWVCVLDGLDGNGHLQHFTASCPSASNLWHFMHSPHDCKKKRRRRRRISIWRQQQMAPSWFNILMSFFNLSPAERALKSKYVWKLPAGSLVISSVNIPTQLDGVSLGKARFINVPGAASQGQQTSRPKEHSSPHRRGFHHSVSEHAPGVRWET